MPARRRRKSVATTREISQEVRFAIWI